MRNLWRQTLSFIPSMNAMASDPELWSLPEEWPSASVVGKAQPELPVVQPRTESIDTAMSGLATELEDELLKGVGLDVCLSGWGKYWSNPGMYGTSREAKTLSFKVNDYNYFLSHDWGTSRRRKVWSLVIMFNTRAAAILNTTFALILGFGVYCEVVPDEFWVHLLPYVIFVLAACFWQRFRRLIGCPHVVFFDKMCIDQKNEESKIKGILGLAAFLDRSEHLFILWSDHYFSRLWCAYELATFLRDPLFQKPVTLFPVAMSEMITVATFVGMLSITSSYVSRGVTGADINDATGAENGADAVALNVLCDLVIIVILFPVACFIGLGLMKDLAQLDQQLKDFRVVESKCFCCTYDHVHPQTGQPLPCDRLLIYDMLRRWYGAQEDVHQEHLDRFDNAVRTSLRQSALRSADDAKMPSGLVFYLSLVIVSPNLAGAAKELATKATFLEVLRYILHRYVSTLLLMAWFFWLYFKLCILGAALARWMPKCAAVIITSCLLFFSVALVYGAMFLPSVFMEEIWWEFLPLVTLVWIIVTLCLFRGGWCLNQCSLKS